jgi:hypothetical protein
VKVLYFITRYLGFVDLGLIFTRKFLLFSVNKITPRIIPSVEFIVTTEKSKCELLDHATICTYHEYSDLANHLIVM